MSEILVYATQGQATVARALLGAACQATGISARLEVYGSGSLFQRLGPRHAPPLPDLVLWSGPFAAHAAGAANLLQPYQPSIVAAAASHDSEWRWVSIDFQAFGITGKTSIGSYDDLAGAPRLAIADPERSEFGLQLVLLTLDRTRQLETDAERAWSWWQQRVQRGLALSEDEPGAQGMVEAAEASHALTLHDGNPALRGLAPLPHVAGVAASARNVEAARQVLDWLVSDQASPLLRLSPWQAAGNGLQQLLGSAPPLDVEWCTQQYTSTRRRWAQSGFSPALSTSG